MKRSTRSTRPTALIFTTEKQLKEYGDKLPADKKAPIETALNKLKDAHKSQNLSGIDSAIAEMNNAWTAASEELYKATQQAGAQGGPGGGQGQPGSESNGGHQASTGGENVTDAEFEEVK